MKKRSNPTLFPKNGLRGAFIVAGIAVAAILFGAYLDLRFFPVAPIASSVQSSSSTISDVGTDTSSMLNSSTTASSSMPVVPANSDYYSNDIYGYSFYYPSIFDTSDTQNKATNDYDGLAQDSLFIASLPESFTKGTNLSAATLIAGAKKVSAKACSTEISGNKITASSERIPPTTITIGDIEYNVVSVSEGAAGSVYTTTRYSTMQGSRCYSVSIVAHGFSDIKTYNANHPDAPIKAYDQSALDHIIDRVMQTFAFTK